MVAYNFSQPDILTNNSDSNQKLTIPQLNMLILTRQCLMTSYGIIKLG